LSSQYQRLWKVKHPTQWKAIQKRANLRYKQSANGRAIIHRYKKSYRQRPLVRYKIREYARDYHYKKRIEALKLFGSKCKRCGCDNQLVLQFDHIDGNGGGVQRKLRDITLYTWILKHPIEARKTFQVLCANCNWIKRVEQKEYLKKQ